MQHPEKQLEAHPITTAEWLATGNPSTFVRVLITASINTDELPENISERRAEALRRTHTAVDTVLSHIRTAAEFNDVDLKTLSPMRELGFIGIALKPKQALTLLNSGLVENITLDTHKGFTLNTQEADKAEVLR